MNLYDDSFLTDDIVDAASQAGIDFVFATGETLSRRELGIMRQATRVEIAAALEAGLFDKIKNWEKPLVQPKELPNDTDWLLVASLLDDKARTDNAFLHAYLTFQNLYEELDGENCSHQEEE